MLLYFGHYVTNTRCSFILGICWKCQPYLYFIVKLVLNFKIENSDPVLDIKCIFCTEMILHALTWILELKEKTNISMCKNEFDLFLVVFQYLIIICLFLLVSRITYYYHRYWLMKLYYSIHYLMMICKNIIILSHCRKCLKGIMQICRRSKLHALEDWHKLFVEQIFRT